MKAVVPSAGTDRLDSRENVATDEGDDVAEAAAVLQPATIHPRKRRPKLLLVTGHASRAGGGVSVAVRDLARIMAADFDVRVLALDDGPTRAEDEPEWQGIDVTTFATTGPKRYGLSFGMLLAVLRARCDIVHVHGLWQFHCLAVLLRCLIRPIPYVVTPHGMLESWILARSRRLKRAIARSYQDLFLRAADAVHVLTPREIEDVSAAIGESQCVVISNFVEPSMSRPPKPGWWEPEFEGRDIFLFLGRIHSKKGCLELCDAWDRLNARNDAFQKRSVLVFCGIVDDIPEFAGRVEELERLFGNVRYAGPQYGQEKDSSLAAATFFCLPSKSEGLPIAVIEAWAFGVPAIMTAECNLPIGFEQDAAIETGIDASSIADSLSEASRLSAGRRAAMADAARALVETSFSAHSARNAYRALYTGIASKRSTRGATVGR